MNSIKMLVMAALTIVSVSVFAQDSTNQKIKPATQPSEKMKYSCPMHPEVTSDKPGKCPKCGMSLTELTNEQKKMKMMKTYACPMHPKETGDKPARCSKCGMGLTEVKQKSPIGKE